MTWWEPKKVIGSRVILVTVILALSVHTSIHAQVSGATLSGIVTDPSGAVIPNAEVSIRNTATGIAEVAATNAAGVYTAPNLVPGSYDVTVKAAGFAALVQSGITLTVGAQQVLNITLKVGATTETVSITGEAPTVELATSAISAEVDATTVRELPLNGRDWATLATLQAGVSLIDTEDAVGSSRRGNRGLGIPLSISGGRSVQNNYRLDGVSINDYTNSAPGSSLGVIMGVDAIREFSVLTSNFSAEYGNSSGGVINAITKSGTNQFHGTAYEFLRNSALDARNFFDKALAPFRRNQFGASGGGPLRKDRTFIFADYEALRQAKSIVMVTPTISPAARAGNLCSAPGTPPVCTPSTITVDPAAKAYFGLFPLPNSNLLPGGDLGNFVNPAATVAHENFFTTRLDHRISDKDNLFATYLYDDSPYTTPDAYANLLNGQKTDRNVAVLEETHIFSPALVNTVRGGYNRVTWIPGNLGVINPVAGDTSLAAVPGQHAAAFTIPGLPKQYPVGFNPFQSVSWYWNTFQGYDDGFLTHGSHTLKFGATVQRMQMNVYTGQGANGQFNFGSVQGFLTNQPISFTGTLGNVFFGQGVRQTLFGTYVQDDWRLRSNLTLNLGMRYETVTVPTEVQNKITTLLSITDATPHVGSPYYQNPTLRDFSPRVGFAWDPFRNGKTSVRGGFGIFDVLPLPYMTVMSETAAAPFVEKGSVSKLPPGSFFKGAYSLLGVSSLGEGYVQENPKRNYNMQWNFNVQREIAPNLTVTAGYVGTHTVHLFTRYDDANMVLPTLTPLGYLWPSPAGSGKLVNPNAGAIRALFWNSNAFYDALLVGVQKKMSHGLQLQGSFTWSKSIDSGTQNGTPDSYTNSVASWYWFDMRISRAVSDFNVGRTLVINGLWDVPVPHSLRRPAAWLAGGWEFGSIFKASDGLPVSVIIGGDPLGQLSTSTQGIPNRVAGCDPVNANFKAQNLTYINVGCFTFPTVPTLLGNAGRNGVNGPGLVNVDFSLFKNIPVRQISETFNVQFRAEFFNLFNRANFAPPTGNTIFDQTGKILGSAGQLSYTVTDSREIQFGLKLNW